MVTIKLCYSRLLLLWTSTVQFLAQGMSGRECPQGQLLHMHKKLYYVTCCYPTRCGVGEEVNPCVHNGTYDTCVTCSETQNQSFRTSSFTMEECIDWPLDRDCKNVNNPSVRRNIFDEQTKLCMCNIEQGKKFDLPEIEDQGASMDSYCQRRHDPCQPGYEPTVDGGCRQCEDNRFTSVKGYNLCEPKTNCTLLGLKFTFLSDATADNNCSEPDHIITPRTSYTDKPYMITVRPSTTPEIIRRPNTTPSTTTSSKSMIDVSLGSVDRQMDDNLTWLIVGAVLGFLVLVASIGLGYYICFKRRGVAIFACANKDRVGSPEHYLEGAISEPRNHQVKHTIENGRIISPTLINGSKMVINATNVAVTSGLGDVPNGHANYDNQHGRFSQSEHGHHDIVQYSNPHQYHVTTPRPGVLRTDRNFVFDQRHGNPADLPSDTLCLVVNGFEADQDFGEADRLLDSEYTQGIPSPQIPILIGSGSRKPNFGQTFVKNVHFSPSIGPHESIATYIPAADTVTFTRSCSLIASPEGEIDEDELEALFPKFSELLPDTSGTDSTFYSVEESPTNKQYCDHGAQPLQQQVGDLHIGTKSQRDTPSNQPDHQVMHLKEQELVEPTQPLSSSMDTCVKTVPSFSFNNTSSSVLSTQASQQTIPKTITPSRTDNFLKMSSNNKTSTGIDSLEDIELKKRNSRKMSHNISERNKHPNTGTSLQRSNGKKTSDIPYFSTQNRVFSENCDGKNKLEQHHRSNNHKSYLQTSPAMGKHQQYHRAVSFEETDTVSTLHKQSPKTSPWQSSRSPNSPVKVVTRLTTTVRSISDPEQGTTSHNCSNTNGSEWKSVNQNCTTSSSSSKTLVNSEQSASNDSNIIQNNSTVYRRSQSQNSPSSSDSSHKPPPRSMSEEKPQKIDRPVAKVKPMPASESCINQLPSEASQDIGTIQLSARVGAACSPTTAILSPSNDDSHHEHGMEVNQQPTLERRTDNDLEDSRDQMC